MTNPTRIEVNCTTGEVTEHELTAEEIEQRELDAIASATEQAEREAAAEALAVLKASARTKLISGDPLTSEEAAVLIVKPPGQSI